MIRRAPLVHAPKRHAQADPVTPEMHAAVMRRDRECVAAKLGFDHVCRTRFGVPHAPFAVDVLTIEHVHEGYGMAGKRATSDLGHMVALCGMLNNRPPSAEMRAAFRQYLAHAEPRFEGVGRP
ncbi:MAG TPA: hypothetical protein VMH41_16930 [Mycobacteriales bacterium]|nr:hypothetical protein [Mycobacteriales bacterium]